MKAENLIELQSCEEVMLDAFSEADKKLEKNFGELMDLEAVTAVGKSQNIAPYDLTYACHAQAICYAVKSRNPIHKFKQVGCIPITVADLEKEFNVSFSSCREVDASRTQRYFSRCDAFAEKKIAHSRIFLQKEFMKEVHLENQTLLAQKILDLREKMTVLIEKVRAFSTHFVKVIDDVNCTSPDPSGR